MKHVRNLALLAVVMLLTWSVGGGTAFGQAFTVLTPPYDTVANNAKDIPLLKVNLTGFSTSDTLISVKLKSYIEKEYAINKISLFKNAATTPFKSYTVSGRFDANYEATLAGFNVPFDDDDTLIVKVDAWTDSVDTDTSYHLTGLELVIPPNGLIFKHGPAVNTTYFTDYIANPAIDAATGLWVGTPVYVVRYDLYAPIYDVAVTVLDTTTAPNSCLTTVNIGDSLFILVNNPNEEISGNSVKVDLSKFGASAALALNYHPGLDSTTLSAPVAAGATTATLANVSKLVVGNSITLTEVALGVVTYTDTRAITVIAGNVVTWATAIPAGHNYTTTGNGVVTYLHGGLKTTLSADVAIGATTATLVSVSALSVGSSITLYNGTNTETRVLTGVNAGTGVVTWVTALAHAYTTVNGVVSWRHDVFVKDTWTDTVRVAALTAATGLDVITGYVIYFTAKDHALNTGTVEYQFTEPIDDIAPKFDSLKFYISGNYTGSDTSAALGDKLTIVAYLTSNGFFEISGVTAVDRWNNFRSDTTSWAMDDVTNGNNIWRVDIWLTEPLPRDLAVGDTILKHIYLTAIDNACNSKTDSLNFAPAIDIEPPVFSLAEYHTITNADSSSCTNLGDSVRVLADLSGSPDIARVYGDFLDAGINGSNEENLVDLGTGQWAKRWKIGSLTDPTKDPDPLYAKGPGLPSPDLDYTVKLWAFDDAGNWDTLRTSALTAVVGGGTAPLDTRRPFAIVVDSVTIKKMPAGKLRLLWPANYPSQANDAEHFYVYVDSTGAGFDYTHVFGTTFQTEYNNSVGPDTNAWTSELLTDSKTYRFVVRTKDACGNPEFNTNVFQAEADAKAPIACVVFPDTAKYYGPDQPLNITATTTGVDLDSAWITYRRLDIPSGTWGPWLSWRGSNYMTVPAGGQTLYENVDLGTAPSTKGYYQLYILTKDLAGNVLLLDSAMVHCHEFSFFWNPDVLAADIVSINGATSPQTNSGFDVWRDSVNTAVVSVNGPVADSIYTIDSWVIFYDVTNRDSVRIEYKDLQAVPFTYTFSVYDWPKSNDGLNTTLYVRITDTRNGSAGIDSARLCVPDVVAPDIYMTYPTAYQRVPIAKSSLNTVPVRAKIGSLSYDPDSPVRVEFFYELDGTSTWVKIGEAGTPMATKGFGGKTALIANPYPEFEVAWDNSLLAEGFVWLKAIVHDNKDNTKESPAIKVYLDKTAPLMKLTIADALTINGKLTITKPASHEYANLVAEITNNTIDIANVDFFISYRDSVDLVKFYHKIGTAYAGTNNSIWRYRWSMDDYPWSGVAGNSGLTSGASVGQNHVHLASVTGIEVGTPVTLSNDELSKALGGDSETLIVDHIDGNTVYFTTNLVYSYSFQDPATWLGAWFKCGYDYKLRVKVTDIAGNVYDDQDGDGQFDDYTFWANPFAAPITLNTPADLSKLIFTLDCGAPQVAISQVVTTSNTETRTYETPSSLLGGPAEVYMKKGEALTVNSVVLDSLFDLGGVRKVEYFFYSPVYGAYKSVGFATASPFNISFDPFALGLITDASVQVNEYQGYIEAVLTDSLNQTSSDEITCWVLDTFPGESKWKTPTHTYVWGTVDLSIWALNGERYHNSYRQVVYKYMPTGGSTWTTIATVLQIDGASQYFEAQWPTLNMVPDGSYILGFETTDKNLNVQPIANNPQITVIVQNALPTVAITSPLNGEFFCSSTYFKADAANGPIGAVDFQYKAVTSSSWTNFRGTTDNFPPYGKYFDTTLADGYYQFRSYALNQAGRIVYSDPITLFYDGTSPLARITSIQATLNPYPTDTVDVEWHNDGSAWINKAIGTVQVTTAAFDSLSPVGSASIYNSGIASIGLYLTAGDSIGAPGPSELIAEISPATDGFHTFTWDISGLAVGWYTLIFKAYDKAGCGMGEDTVSVDIIEFHESVGLVAGLFHGKIVGVSYSGETVQFQYKTTGDWIPIGIGSQVDYATKSLYYPEGRWQDYGVYIAGWAPTDGNYQLRMLTGYGDSLAPVLSVTIANGAITTVTSNPATGWGPGTVEVNQEEGCNLDGIARFTSTYGYPFGVGIAYNVYADELAYELIDFRNLPQQNPASLYAGPVGMTSGGANRDSTHSWRGITDVQVDFCDYSGVVGYAKALTTGTFWVTKDLGTGGPITVATSPLDQVTVTIPPEWTDDQVGWKNELVIWGSSTPAASIAQDWLLTPITNRAGNANYIGLPSRHCHGLCRAADDQRYAIIKMTYDQTCNIPEESLMVAYWDGEGNWLTDDIYFPSTVYNHGEGFNTADHTVEFAVTCFKGTYAVIKRTPLANTGGITRMFVDPLCHGYTNGYPSFGYQFREVWANSVDWSTLEVMVDGVRIYTNESFPAVKPSPAPTATGAKTVLGSWAKGWTFNIDETAARLYFDHYTWSYNNDSAWYDYYAALECGVHILTISAHDQQGRTLDLTDTINVDCVKPVVVFPNKYVGKDPTIKFTITDDLAGVNWDAVYVDVFFVTKDTANYYDYAQERVAFIQTFFPDQIKNYLSGNTVTITTSYNLENVRGMLVVVYDGHRRVSTDDYNNWGIDPGAYDQFDEYYFPDGGASDCVGNYATPHVQYFTVDSKSPTIVRNSTTTVCPMVFTISDDGSGISDSSIVIRENGTVLPASAEQTSASAVNSSGKWFFAPSGGGGLLYYCPTPGAIAEITITDATGNKTVILVSPESPLGEGDVVGEAGPNPFDPAKDESMNIRVTLNVSAYVTVKIYDMGGDLVTTLRNNIRMEAGPTYVGWNGTTEGGTTVANGVYLAHIEVTGVGGGNASTVVKIAVVQK